MNKSFFRILFTAIFLLFSTTTLLAQDVTGIWKGYFITERGEYYKLEFQVNQNKTAGVNGVSYSYLDVRFYGKATMTGMFIKESQTFKIREIKTVEIKSLDTFGACIMNYSLKYAKSGNEEFLEGVYLGKTEVKTGPNPYPWGQCGSGKVSLRRVVESSFYIEPFLRGKINKDKPVIVNQPPIKKDIAKNTETPKPENKPAVVKKEPEKKPIVKSDPPVVRKDTAKKINTEPVVKLPAVKAPPPAVIKNRTNELVKALTVRSAEVTVKIYDNGEIDDDTISVFLDNRPMLMGKKLTASPLSFTFDMGEDNDEHELVMVAENLGRIPPNTSLMIVESGGQRFDVRITSTEQKNAVVRFKLEKPK